MPWPFIRLIQGFLVYLLFALVFKVLDMRFIPFGSLWFFGWLALFPVVWPILRPGVCSIPIFGDFLALLDNIGRVRPTQDETSGEDKLDEESVSCPNCDHEIMEDVSPCPNCGAKLKWTD